MGKERVMKDVPPFTDFQKCMVEFIEAFCSDRIEPLSDEERDLFWNQFHKKLLFHEKKKSTHKEESKTAEEEKEAVLEQIATTSIDRIKRCLNVNIRLLFLLVMSFNIIWMQVLSKTYGNNTLIIFVKWMMIIAVVSFLISWAKPYKKAFWNISVHD